MTHRLYMTMTSYTYTIFIFTRQQFKPPSKRRLKYFSYLQRKPGNQRAFNTQQVPENQVALAQ